MAKKPTTKASAKSPKKRGSKAAPEGPEAPATKRARPGAFLLYLTPDERARLEQVRAQLEAEETARLGIRRPVALSDVLKLGLARLLATMPPSSPSDRAAPTAAPEAPVLAALAELAGDRPGGTTPPVPEGSTPAPATPTPEPLEDRVLAAVSRLTPERPGGVSLDDLRAALPDASREQLLEAVAELRRTGVLAPPEGGAP